MTAYQQHVKDWGTCTRCPLHLTRKRVVLVRGQLPCDVLFVGEAPGRSEDVLGQPFVGPAGQLLDRIIKSADRRVTIYAFTNLVACIPLGDDGNKTAEPSHESILACRPRLGNLIKIAQPKLVACVGSLAEDHVPELVSVPIVHIVHPAAILRAPTAQQGMMVKKAVVTLAAALEEL